MSTFASRLAELQGDVDLTRRTWIFVPYDQLTDRFGPLAELEPARVGVVLVESTWKARRRPYHKQKLALVLANLRHFALEQAARGVAVRHIATDLPYGRALEPIVRELGPLRMMRPAERELRADLAPLVRAGDIDVLPHGGWLTTTDDFRRGAGDAPWRMDRFYQHVRQSTGILMEDGKPLGGKYSHDAANREFWPGTPAAPTPPTFEPDDITREVVALVEQAFPDHPGAIDAAALPATAADAQALWTWAKAECMQAFGPFEDALSTRSRGIFHTRIAQVLNLHRLTPRQVVDDVLELDIPISSKEGFVRQVIGWREFVRHVHEATDGFRKIPGTPATSCQTVPGDGGWSTWSGASWPSDDGGEQRFLDGGATPRFLGRTRPLPPAFWGEKSGLRCLDHVVGAVWDEAWTHHIPRLMVLGNLATLLDIDPRELTDWFWVAFVDAYDWVVEPNVLAMATFGTGPVMTTKPYVAGANYIDKMSDYCEGCAFHPKKTCPVTHLYWAWLGRHGDAVRDNHRMRMILGTLGRRSAEKKAADARIFEHVSAALARGDAVSPETVVRARDDG